MRQFLRNTKVSIPLGIGVLALLAWVVFGVFGVHLLFVDDEVNEALPAFDSPAAAAPAAAPGEVTVTTEVAGSFVSREHETTGRAFVLGDGSGQRFLRFEEFATTNGPDLNVYLVDSSTGDVSDFVDLGNLKGNIGDQNYEIPVGTDLSKYDTVVVWCVRFSANFGDAVLAPV